MSLSPYRMPAERQPEPPETEEPYAAVLRAQARRGQLTAIVVSLSVAGALAAAMMRAAPSRAAVAREREAARVASARDAVEAAEKGADLEQATLAAALRDVAPLEPGRSACPAVLPPLGSLARGRRTLPLVTVSPEDAAAGRIASPTIVELRADVRRASEHLAAGRHEEALAYARALAHPTRLRFDVVLVARSETKPVATSPSSYVPGEIDGRAYLYDFGARRFVCAADIKAASSRALGYTYATAADAPAWLGRSASHSATLEDDLRLAIERSVVTELRALTP